MAPSTTSHRRLLLPLFLAVMLVGEAAGLATAALVMPGAGSVSVAPVVAPTGAAAALAVPPARDARHEAPGNVEPQDHARPSLGRAAAIRPEVATTARAAVVAPSRSTSPSAASYKGRNHVWIPALGIKRSVASFPCTRSQAPGNHIYRWGCSGRNNVYLMGHAHSVFKALHDAYVSGRLRKGMKVIYADGAGRVRTYSVIWWKVTRPTTSASWAWAAQTKPSMTLQTCVGANGELRLMVRLAATG